MDSRVWKNNLKYDYICIYFDKMHFIFICGKMQVLIQYEVNFVFCSSEIGLQRVQHLCILCPRKKSSYFNKYY